MIDVKQEDDNTFTISWDENDPQESIFNDFTEEDFINLIQDYLTRIKDAEITTEELKTDCTKGLNFNAKVVHESNYEGYNQTEEDYRIS